MTWRQSRWALICLILALACLAGALVLSLFAARWGVSDWISFGVMSGYVVFMLAFLVLLEQQRRREPPTETGEESGDDRAATD